MEMRHFLQFWLLQNNRPGLQGKSLLYVVCTARQARDATSKTDRPNVGDLQQLAELWRSYFNYNEIIPEKANVIKPQPHEAQNDT